MATLPDFGTYLMTNLLQDISADLLPDAQAILGLVQTNGASSLLLPQNALMVNAFLVKAQADAMNVGNDLSKQIATYVSMWLANKFTPPTPASGKP